MATFNKFEDIDAWKKSRILDGVLFKTIETNLKFSKDYSLKDQMLRSSGSTMDNIAEGFERGGKAEFIHFLSISKGSSGELRSQLYRALDRGYLSESEFEKLKAEAENISGMLQGLMNYLNKSELKGVKFKNRI